MRACKALVVTVLLLAFQVVCVFGASVPVFKPDPVGEKIYREHMLPQLFPLTVIGFALLVLAVVAVVHKVHRKDTHPAPPEADAQHC